MWTVSYTITITLKYKYSLVKISSKSILGILRRFSVVLFTEVSELRYLLFSFLFFNLCHAIMLHSTHSDWKRALNCHQTMLIVKQIYVLLLLNWVNETINNYRSSWIVQACRSFEHSLREEEKCSRLENKIAMIALAGTAMIYAHIMKVIFQRIMNETK